MSAKMKFGSFDKNSEFRQLELQTDLVVSIIHFHTYLQTFNSIMKTLHYILHVFHVKCKTNNFIFVD